MEDVKYQEIRSLDVDFDKGVLKINGVDVKEQVRVYLPSTEGWELSRLFNPDPSGKIKFDMRIVVSNKL